MRSCEVAIIWPDQIIYQPNDVDVFGEDVQLEVLDFDGLLTNIENSPNKNTGEQQTLYVWKKVQSDQKDQKDIFGLHFQGQRRLGCPKPKQKWHALTGCPFVRAK